jgi:hypothetical protein
MESTSTHRSRAHLARRGRVRALVAALLAISLLAGCAGGDDAMTSAPAPSVDMVTPMDAEMADRGFADDAGAPMEAAGDGSMPVPGAPTGQLVVRTAYLAIETEDSAAAYDEVLDIARRAGGYAATTDLQRHEDGSITGWVTLRVPTDRLFDVVGEIEELGESVPVSRVDEIDVTTEAANLDARLANLRVYESELLELLGDVRSADDSSAEDLVLVFERIRQARQEIDFLEAQKQSLEDRISLATVTVELRQRAPVPTAGEVIWRPGETFQAAIAATVRLLSQVADGIIWTALTIVPVTLAVLLVPAIVVWLLVRRRRTRTQPPPPPGAPTGQSATTRAPSGDDAH